MSSVQRVGTAAVPPESASGSPEDGPRTAGAAPSPAPRVHRYRRPERAVSPPVPGGFPPTEAIDDDPFAGLPPGPVPGDPAGARRPRKVRIVVAEDESLVALHIRAMLEGMGYEVAGVAASGEEIVAAAEATRADLVLMDIMLRGEMDGIRAAEKIRERRSVPIIYLTAYADEATLERAKRTQPFGYLLKPFDERELYTAIETALFKHAIESRLKERERWLTTILSGIADGVISTDRAGRVTFMNPVAEALTGRTGGAWRGRALREALTILRERTRKPVDLSPRGIQRMQDGPMEERSGMLLRDGERVPVDFGAAVLRDEAGAAAGTVIILRDVTQRRQQEEKLRFLAIHDALTGLPNRLLFKDRLDHALAAAPRKRSCPTVLLLDIDGFKSVNDTFGHSAGDALLIRSAERLTALLRKGDTVARMGGDEFLLLLPDLAPGKSPEDAAARVLDAFRRPFEFEGRPLRLTVSIGIAVHPEHGEDADTLIRNADIAMYTAKTSGRNRACRFGRERVAPGASPAMDGRESRREGKAGHE